MPSISTANHTFFEATNKIFFNKDKRISSHLSKKQSATCLADLPALAQENISQHLQKFEYKVDRYESTLPSGKISRYRAFNPNENMSVYFTDHGVQLLPKSKGRFIMASDMIFSGVRP